MTASFHELEKSTYDQVRAQPFTTIHNDCSFMDKEQLVRELAEVATEMDVHYEWCGEFGLLALAIGDERYTADTELEPEEIEKPPPSHPDAAASTAAQAKVLEKINDLDKRSWAIVRGFKRAAGENIRDALPEKCFKRLKEKLYVYKRRAPRDYIEHLEEEWCPLDEDAIDVLMKHYKRPWDRAEEHATEFSRRLEDEKEEYGRHEMVITNKEMIQHYSHEMLRSNLFDKPTQKEWRVKTRAAAKPTWEQTTAFFEEALKGEEYFQRNSGDTKENMGYGAGINAATEIVNDLKSVIGGVGDATVENQGKLNALATTSTTHAASIKAINDKLDGLTRALTDITNKLNNAPTSQQRLPPTPPAGGGDGRNSQNVRKTAAELNTDGWTWTPDLVLEDKRKWPGFKKKWYGAALFEWKKEFPNEAKAKMIEASEAYLKRLKDA